MQISTRDTYIRMGEHDVVARADDIDVCGDVSLEFDTTYGASIKDVHVWDGDIVVTFVHNPNRNTIRGKLRVLSEQSSIAETDIYITSLMLPKTGMRHVILDKKGL
jgi:hypothetical protein